MGDYAVNKVSAGRASGSYGYPNTVGSSHNTPVQEALGSMFGEAFNQLKGQPGATLNYLG